MVPFCALLTCALWLAPPLAIAEAQFGSVVSGRLSTTAHTDFKIVIPGILSLQMLSVPDSQSGMPRVAVGSNGRTVALAATVAGAKGQRRDSIIGAGARRSIDEQSTCAITGHGAARMICVKPSRVGGLANARTIVAAPARSLTATA